MPLSFTNFVRVHLLALLINKVEAHDIPRYRHRPKSEGRLAELRECSLTRRPRFRPSTASEIFDARTLGMRMLQVMVVTRKTCIDLVFFE